MKLIRILLTTVGCPGGVTMIRALKEHGERPVEIIGTDMNPLASGRFFSDVFYPVPAGTDPAYPETILHIARKEKVDLILPQSSSDVMPLSPLRDDFRKAGFPIMIPKTESAVPCDSKSAMNDFFKESSVPLPETRTVNTVNDFRKAVLGLGYPDKRVCFKPAVSKGSRGFRILEAGTDRLNMLLKKRIEDTTFTLEECEEILRQAARFPDLIVSEFLEGTEITVDCYCRNGKVLLGFTKTREAMKAGLAMFFRNQDAPEYMEYARDIVHRLEYDYFINIQFKGGKLMEINPRVSTFVHQENFNIPWAGVKHELGLISLEELTEIQKNLRTTRQSVRYYDQVFYDSDEVK
ncbi:MAG: hypothetical protein DRP86_01685 [Candidatus Neomarinimicrobiota bacterium]|nr:MAG: hypothetical protein DRP86_01685 [Candidatus Neomarinimicrobiota bacterium]